MEGKGGEKKRLKGKGKETRGKEKERKEKKREGKRRELIWKGKKGEDRE